MRMINAGYIIKLGSFVSNKRPVTESGRLLYQHAKQMINQLDYVKTEIAALEGGLMGTLAIGVATSCAKYLHEMIHAYRQHYPDVFIKMYKGDSAYLEQLLLTEEIELAFMLQPADLTNYDVIRLKQEPFVVVMPTSWHQQLATPAISLQQVNKYPLLMLGAMDGFSIHENILNFFSLKNLTPNIVLECKDIFTLLNFVVEKIGVAILPQSEIHDVFANQLQAVAIKDVTSVTKPSIITLKYATPSRRARFFMDVVAAILMEKYLEVNN